MRVFLAVDLRDTLGQAAQGWGRAVAAAIGARAAADMKWVPAANVHVTLRFFGTLDAAAVDAVLAALGDRVPLAPFELGLGPGGTFPPAGRPRVLWLGLSAGAGALAALHAWVTPRVDAFGEPDRHAGYTPHLTIARVRREARAGGLREAAAATSPPEARAHIDAITLFESVSSGKGAIYRPIGRVPLGGEQVPVSTQGSGTASAPRPASNATPFADQ
jgi:2'-5' RNA ligase